MLRNNDKTNVCRVVHSNYWPHPTTMARENLRDRPKLTHCVGKSDSGPLASRVTIPFLNNFVFFFYSLCYSFCDAFLRVLHPPCEMPTLTFRYHYRVQSVHDLPCNYFKLYSFFGLLVTRPRTKTAGIHSKRIVSDDFNTQIECGECDRMRIRVRQARRVQINFGTRKIFEPPKESSFGSSVLAAIDFAARQINPQGPCAKGMTTVARLKTGERRRRRRRWSNSFSRITRIIIEPSFSR